MTILKADKDAESARILSPRPDVNTRRSDSEAEGVGQWTFETNTGEKRTVIEFEIDEIGLSLRYTAATATGTPANRPVDDEAPVPDEAPVQDKAPRVGWRDRLKAQQEAAASAIGTDGYPDNDPWSGKNSTGEGYAHPARAAEPTFCNWLLRGPETEYAVSQEDQDRLRVLHRRRREPNPGCGPGRGNARGLRFNHRIGRSRHSA